MRSVTIVTVICHLVCIDVKKMSKRKFEDNSFSQIKRRHAKSDAKKHSLDSDEEDEHDEAEDELDADDIEGEEEGISRQVEGVRMTAFNMREEMEEGHFDKEGHFIWKNEKEIRDNWLDNVEWHKIQNDDKYQLDPNDKALGDESESDDNEEQFDEVGLYKKMLKFMKPKETVNKTIRRLGGDNTKLSSVERLKRKKAGTLNNNQDVVDMTEFANTILTKMGNMDVYQETFEEISKKIEDKTKLRSDPVLDMYADDFETKEKQKMGTSTESESKEPELMWEFKWEQNKDEVQGPFDTKQMFKWANEGYFKTGVWVRKCGELSNFYTSNRIDFELYL